jgi:hypothetical protein
MRVIACVALLVVAGCDEPKPIATTTPSASATPSATASASAAASAEPKQPAYSGPTGTLTGTVRIKGDAPPDTSHDYPKECSGAMAMYGKLFRVGKDRELADAIVGVSKYQGYVPPKEAAIRVTIKGCAFSTRSIAMTDGQHLEVRNRHEDTTSFIPWLEGARLPASLVAVPQGDPVKLYSRGFGRYWLRDQMGKKFMVAHVFHMTFATTAVTGTDGKYRIESIPVGKVEVTAMLPQANLLTDPPNAAVDNPGRSIEIKEGENHADFELVFDRKRDTPDISDEATADERRNAPKK